MGLIGSAESIPGRVVFTKKIKGKLRIFPMTIKVGEATELNFLLMVGLISAPSRH